MRGLLTVGIAARSLGIPVMIWDKLDRPHGWLDWLQLPLANKVAFIAEAVKIKFPAWQLKYYHNRLSTVPEGADVTIIDAIQALKRSELNIKDEAIVFAIVGSITQRKGQDRILAILPALVAQIPNVESPTCPHFVTSSPMNILGQEILGQGSLFERHPIEPLTDYWATELARQCH